MTKNNIFNITPNYNFLTSLVKFTLEKYPDPLSLANVTILLPSRRSCRELKTLFLRNSNNSAIILPNIKAIGDVDYDDTILEDAINNSLLRNEKHQDLTYKTLLMQEIGNWNKAHHLFGKNVNMATIAQITDKLQSFLNEVEKEGLELKELEKVQDFELANHKQKILAFLRHFGSNWQNILSKNGIVSKTQSLNQMLEFYCNHLERKENKYPVIAAGSTGSVKATLKLLKTVSNLENGHLILFGVDKFLDKDIWQEIDEKHPQFILKKLLDYIGLDRSSLKNIQYEDCRKSDSNINRLSSISMLPAKFCDKWLESHNLDFKNINNLSFIEAEDNFKEAEIISLILRESIEEKQKTTALISNDKNLIKTVKSNLAKWQININDSTSNNLLDCELVNYLLLIGDFLCQDFQIINLLTILKHPLTVTKMEKGFFKENLEIFEIKILRDVIKFNNFNEIIKEISNRSFEELKNKENLLIWVKNIEEIFYNFRKEVKKERNDFKILLTNHVNCFEQLTMCNIANKKAQITLDQDGIGELTEFYLQASQQINSLQIESKIYCQLLQNFLQGYKFRCNKNYHPRLHILSTMEARLLNFDSIIISGLNEGSFPSSLDSDWLGNKIRSEFGLCALDKTIGISSYDFCNYLGQKEVILTHSKNKNNAPATKSRFLFRLEIITNNKILQNKTKYYKYLLDLISKDGDQEKLLLKIGRPNPQIPQEHNLKNISVTDIGKWIRDPYFIYAKRILRLKHLKQIEQEPSFAEFGNFVHSALENFIKNDTQTCPEAKLDHLLNIYGKEAFEKTFPDKNSKFLWWSKFTNIAIWFVQYEINLRENLQEVFVEVEARNAMNGIVVSTKIDRVNIYKDGKIEIIDYKTGIIPTQKDIKSGLESQLAMESIILSDGEIVNYKDLRDRILIENITNLKYIELKGKDKNRVTDLQNIDDLIDSADLGIIDLISKFSSKNISYICCPNFDIYKRNDYSHLARIDQWVDL